MKQKEAKLFVDTNIKAVRVKPSKKASETKKSIDAKERARQEFLKKIRERY